MHVTAEQRAYWRKNLRLTGLLLALWFAVTFLTTAFAREINAVSLFGFPLGFYMSAQGSVLVYVLIIGVYARYMNRLDESYRQRKHGQNKP